MTMNNTQQRNESDDFTTTFDDLVGFEDSVTKTKPKVIVFPEPVWPASPAGYKSIDDVVAKFESTDKGRFAMKHGRTWVAKAFYGDVGETIRTLRLTKGLSQSELAKSLGTSQSHVARIERGRENPLIKTCRRLCDALGIDMNTLDEAMRRQEVICEAKTKC
ncbi:MAG: helix-turn-helix transcriptional regulator [Proteobacteria bacterium]|nr:helix-turn-helix transcriptional regulator [Pseudomonadota bacterium]